MREAAGPRPGEREDQTRRPYVAPDFESETVFETMALRCGKAQSEGGEGEGGKGGDRVRPNRMRVRNYKACRFNRKNS